MAPPFSIHLLGADPTTAAALRSVAVPLDLSGTAVVGEGALDGVAGEEVGRRLGAGEVVVVLAQRDSAAAYYPVAVSVRPPATPARFTVDRGVLPSLVAGAFETAGAVAGTGPLRFPDRAVVGASQGTVVGSHQVGPGRLVFCQLELCAPASDGDGCGRAVLAELMRWVLVPRPTLAVEERRHADGRRVARYSHAWSVAR